MSKVFHSILQVDAGKPRILGRPFIERCKELPDGRYKIVVSRAAKRRSTDQNAYYWQLLTILGKELGYYKDEMHEVLKYKFLRRDRGDNSVGEVFTYVESTKNLNTKEFTEYIDSIKNWAGSEMGINLPDPGEQIEIL